MNDFEFDNSRKSVCQGDVYLIPIKAVPEGMEPIAPENGHFIITHSETGHHHAIKERPDVKQYAAESEFRGFLELSESALLEHLRDHDTHEAQVVGAGSWLIQRQAAYTPQGWERARD